MWVFQTIKAEFRKKFTKPLRALGRGKGTVGVGGQEKGVMGGGDDQSTLCTCVNVL
jgi:hypothetical protein